MRCKQFRRLTVLVGGGELSARQQVAVDEHGATCPACVQFAAEMGTVQRLLHSGVSHRPPTGFEQSVMARIRAQREVRS